MSHIHKLSYNHLSSFKPPPKLLKDSTSHIEIENCVKNAMETDFSIISADSDYQDQFEEIVEQEFSLPLFQSSLAASKTLDHLIHKSFEEDKQKERNVDDQEKKNYPVGIQKDEQRRDMTERFNFNPLNEKIHIESYDENKILGTNEKTFFDISCFGNKLEAYQEKHQNIEIDVAKSYIDILKDAEHDQYVEQEIKMGLKEPKFEFHFEFDFDIESFNKPDIYGIFSETNNNMEKINSQHKSDSNLEESEYGPEEDKILTENFANDKVDTLFQESNSERFDNSFHSSICEDYLQTQFNKELTFKTSESNEFNDDILINQKNYERFYENHTNEKNLIDYYESSPEKTVTQFHLEIAHTKNILNSCNEIDSEQKSEIYETLEMGFKNLNLNLENKNNKSSFKTPLNFENFETSNEKIEIFGSANMRNSDLIRSIDEKHHSSNICEVRTNEKKEQNLFESPEIRKNEINFNTVDNQDLSDFYNSPTLGKNSKIQNIYEEENSKDYDSQEKINEAFCASVNTSNLLNSEPIRDFLNIKNNDEAESPDDLKESENLARKLRDCALSNIYPPNNHYEYQYNQQQNKIIYSPRFRENTGYNDFEIEQIILRKSQAVYQSQLIQSDINQSDFSFAEMDPENKENSSAIYSDAYHERNKSSSCLFEKNLLSPRFDDSKTENLSFSNFYDKTVNMSEPPKLFLKTQKTKEKKKILQKSRKLSVVDENKYIEKIISSTAENTKSKMKKGLMHMLEEKGKINFKKKKNIF